MLHLRLLTWNDRAGTYLPLPDGTRVRAVDGGLFRGVVSEDRVRGGGAALEVDERTGLNSVKIEVSLEGDALDADGRRVPDGTPGSWTPPDPWIAHLGHRRPRGGEGTAETPFVARFGREAFLRFVWWCEATGDFRPAPAGLRVTAWNANLLGDSVIGRGETDADGRVRLALDEGEDAPDLSFRVEPAGGATAGDAVAAGGSAGDGAAGGSAGAFRMDGPWRSRDAPGDAHEEAQGYWADWASQRLGTPEEPYTFALDGSGPRRHPGNAVELLVDGPRLLAAWEAAIASARETIHFEVMLYFDDPMTRRIQARILERARAGVRVRLLLGLEVTRAAPEFVVQQMAWLYMFRRRTTEARAAEVETLGANLGAERRRADVDALIAELLVEPNVTVLDSSFARVEVLPGVRGTLPAPYEALEGRLPWFALARVDHRKLLVVDGRVAVLGGQNVGQEYVYERPFDPAVPDREEEWVKWHDVSVRLAGPVVGDLQHRFRERWVTEGGDAFPVAAQATFPRLAPVPGGLPVRIVDTTPGARRHYHAKMLALFAGARRRILVMSPYFSNPEALGALTAAARRGVPVTLVLPYEHTDSVDFLYAARLWYAEMIEAGIAVYEYQHHMNHAKVAVVDDVAVVGTANLNHSSFFFHYELAAVVEDAGFAADMAAALWDHDLPWCRRIRMEDVPGLLDLNAAGQAYVRTVVHRRF